MKWRGQGGLIVLVLIAAGVFAYQWTSNVKLEDEVMSFGVNYRPYLQSVNTFVEENKRWPYRDEVTLPTPERGGLIRKVSLEDDGQLVFTFSAWSLRSGFGKARLAATINTNPSSFVAADRLSYNCLEVDPIKLEPFVCRTIGYVTREQLLENNADAFTRWRSNELEAQTQSNRTRLAVERARNTRTQCDILWARAEAEVIPCLQTIDADLAEEFSRQANAALNGPRLRPEVIAREPSLLEGFNRECDSGWNALTGLAKAMKPEVARCF